jgi:MOSC domain-containing protein
MSPSAGTVTRLSIAPVKGLAVVAVDRVSIGPNGVEEDRRFFMLDPRGEVVTIRRHGMLEPVVPQWNPASGWLTLDLPGDRFVAAEVELGEPASAVLYGKPRVGREVLGPFSDALSALAGEAVRLVMADEVGTGWDEAPVSIVSRASLDEVARRGGLASVDPRRFRMLVEVEGPDPHGEDEWIGGEVRIGGATLRAAFPIERCAIVTKDPDSGRVDWNGLKVLADYRGKDNVCMGIAAEVVEPGEVALGDTVEVLVGTRR